MPTIEAQHGQLCSDPFLRGTRVFGPADFGGFIRMAWSPNLGSYPRNPTKGVCCRWYLREYLIDHVHELPGLFQFLCCRGPGVKPKVKPMPLIFIGSRGRLWKYYVQCKNTSFNTAKSTSLPYHTLTSCSRKKFCQTHLSMNPSGDYESQIPVLIRTAAQPPSKGAVETTSMLTTFQS